MSTCQMRGLSNMLSQVNLNKQFSTRKENPRLVKFERKIPDKYISFIQACKLVKASGNGAASMNTETVQTQ